MELLIGRVSEFNRTATSKYFITNSISLFIFRDENFISNLKSLFHGLSVKLKESNRLFTSSCDVLQGSDIELIKLSSLFKIADFNTVFNSYSHVNNEKDALEARSFSTITEYNDDLLRIFNTHQQIERYKIVIGFPFDSPQFIRMDNDTKLNRFVDYNTICELLSNEDWEKSFDNESGLSIARSKMNEKGEELSVVFESSRSIANVMRYAVKREFGGAMISLLHKDDVHGKCGFEEDTWTDFNADKGISLNISKRSDPTYPLLKTVNEAIEVTLDALYKQEFIDAH